MKTRILAVATAIVVFLVSGCGAFFGNEKQYDKGDWWFLADSREVARIKNDKLALEKLKQSGAEAKDIGYKGTIYNSSAYKYANIIVTGGPEQRGFYLKPQEKIYYNFIPGTYVAALYDDYGNIIGLPWVFYVGLQKHYFMGEEVYWYLVAPRY